MKVHFIAIGGSAMHNLALALHHKGYKVTGSDDEIFDPARGRLEQYGLLPEEEGWHPERITRDLDAVVLGMHARADNPELIRAQELGLKIYSYPEYLYEQSKEKKRIVVGGSHGKTTTTAMILHVLAQCDIEADYMVGAQLKGFDVMVRLSHTAKVMVIEGDEYLTSPIDRRPKFHLYKPHVAIITGIEWDHINVFPTFDIYREQFSKFIDLIEPAGTCIYCDEDPEVRRVAIENRRTDIRRQPYRCPEHIVENGVTFLKGSKDPHVPLRIFGHHNLLNLTAARLACRQLGVTDGQFDEAISSFEGASKRLELVKKNDKCAVYKDFAHAPSKLRATIHAMREQYPGRRLVACMELHTFSSLTQEFLQQYRGTMDEADVRCVYFSQHALQLKKLPPLDPEQVKAAFGGNVAVYTDSQTMVDSVISLFKNDNANSNLLMMSSGNFDGIDFSTLADKIL
ncbi:MAG: UDP-N-acetylmuramate-alanine ligase [bacterium P3]|nr:MAG: UDP-N-acetylmuramate-alanine ligase [bacterium P3]KWW42205.1 MAG: UDP-N-acetylmuramate-alanine ligase [bacterium F083]